MCIHSPAESIERAPLWGPMALEPRGDVDNPHDLDPIALGFMCGLEIHQQLATGKLHSRMPSELFDYGIDEVPDDLSLIHI